MSVSEVKAGMPFAGTMVAKYLDKQIDALKGVKTQREIALEAGYDKPNIISMFKRGEAKVPLDKIPALAKALHVDPTHLFRLALQQYWPNLGEAIETVFGRIATPNEEEILLKPWRAATGNLDPKQTVETMAAMAVFLNMLPKNMLKK
jgi:transcriptional regulator with XRE-family HTH domain